MSTATEQGPMKLEDAKAIADDVVAQLAPHCERIQIAGSIRRKRPTVNDIEIVMNPKPYFVGMFASGIATVIDKWPKIIGELPCLHTQRLLPAGVRCDLFIATELNWGMILALRTGSKEFSHKVLACGWVAHGYKSANGILSRADGSSVYIREEEDLFHLLGLLWVPPENREV